MIALAASLAVLLLFGVALIGAYALGRKTQADEDAPRLDRGRIDGRLLHHHLPHTGAYDQLMRTEVQRRA